MKKSFLSIVAFIAITITCNAQAISNNDILGKWKLQTIESNGDKISAKEAYGTSEIFQVYKEDNIFKGIVGDETSEGKWEISGKKIAVTVKGEKSKTIFNVISFQDNKLSLSIKDGANTLTLNYKKE